MAALAVATRIIEDSRIYSQDGIYDANGDIVQGTYTLNGTTSTVNCPDVSWAQTYTNSAFSGEDQMLFSLAM